MDDFEYIYYRILRDIEPVHGRVSVQIKALSERFVYEMTHESHNPSLLKKALVALLAFLNTPEGRTGANCWAVNLLVSHYVSQAEWPEDLDAVLFDVAATLHDTFNAPHIAEQFQSTPEQLLERAIKLPY